MLPQFINQILQLPLIATSWPNIQNWYKYEKTHSLYPIRLILLTIEQMLSSVYGKLIQPLSNRYQNYLIYFDTFLCSRIGFVRDICPFIDRTSDELIKYYGHLFIFPSFNKFHQSSSMNSNSKNVSDNSKRKTISFIEPYLQSVTSILMTTEVYSKYIQNEFYDYIDASRTLWKNLNMEDGRTLDEVQTFTEKLLVLGRRITGNCRQFVYLIRYRLKRCRSMLFSLLHIHKWFCSTTQHVIERIEMNKLHCYIQHGSNRIKQFIRQHLDILMCQAKKHPWMKWAKSPKLIEKFQPQLPRRPFELIRPVFFLSSNNTSDSSESEENTQEQFKNVLESTPYRVNHKYSSDITQSKAPIEDAFSNISSSSSSSMKEEQSLDTKEILRQVGLQSHQISESNESMDMDASNRLIQQALNQTDGTEQQQDPISIFDFSPTLASGCAV